VLGGDGEDLARGLGDAEGDLTVLAVEEGLEALGLDLVAGRDLRVVGLVGKPEGQDTLLLEVCLVDTGKRAGDNELSSTTSIHGSLRALYFCMTLGIVSSPLASRATLIWPPSSLTAVMSVFSEMLDRWPLNLSHGPAAEMWSVVHLPRTRRRQVSSGSSAEPLAKTESKGSRISRRVDDGEMAISVSGWGAGIGLGENSRLPGM
jgi:hypothetical protein